MLCTNEPNVSNPTLANLLIGRLPAILPIVHRFVFIHSGFKNKKGRRMAGKI